jgi:hypothetical protein
MNHLKFEKSYVAIFAAVSALAPLQTRAAVSANSSTTPVAQGQTNGVNNPAETITFEGQGSLNKVIGSAAFGYLNLTGNNGTASITLDNGPGDTPTTYTDTSNSSSAYLNLASQNFTKGDVGVNSPTTAQQTQSALRLEWHWNGTIDGSNDLINDQVGYNQATGSVAPQQGANRGPTVANPVYVNGTNHFDGTATGTGANNLVTLNGFQLSNNGTYNTYSATNYDQAGNNLIGGTNRVQFSFSDYKTIDYSQPGTPSVHAAPGAAGYGNGNPAIPAVTNNLLGIGVAGAREAYQSGSIANMPTTNIDPGTVSTANPGGTGYAAGPWNTAGLDNISSTPVAANAVLIAANPGTGLSRLNLRDSQWIQTAGRLANGMMFNTVTRDADLGQRPSFATATGIDSTWAVGVNDGGDTTTTANAILQRSIGSMKFSGKSSDTEVYNAIAQSRMSAGVLALTSTIAATATAPVRSLDIDFTDMTDPQLPGGGVDTSKFISANLSSISTYAYQAVLLGYVTTIKAPNPTALANEEAANPTLTAAQAWALVNSFNASNPRDPTATGIKGDTTGDVAKFLTNLLNSQASYQSLTTTNDPADAFLNNSYLLPNLLQNQRDPATGIISPNPNYDAAGFTKATAIYGSKFNADYSGSYGKVTETTGAGSYYGGAANNSNGSVGASPSNFNGGILITAFNAGGSVAADGTMAPRGNWLFGNFNQNGVRDLSAVESGLAAAKALYAVEPAGTSAPNSAFNVTSGIANAANSTPVTWTGVDGVSHTMTKGDLIVMGDFLSVGKFDGLSLGALARGAAVSDATGTGYTTGTLSGGQAAFADAVRNGVSRKNDALAYMQSNTSDAMFNGITPTNASAFLRQSGQAVLTMPGVTTAAGVPRNATALNTLDPDSGLERFTYDPTGVNSFNNHDVNLDGVVDFNDAVLVDHFNGQDYTNMTQQLAATQQTPVTGTTEPISLINVKQSDGSTVIGASDLSQINAGLTGSGNTNWYAYSLNKTGPGTIVFGRSGGTVTVYPGATFQISAGKVTVASAIDPFTDSSSTGLDTTQSVALTLGGSLEYAAGNSGVQIENLASLNIPAGGLVTLDASSGRTLLVTGALSMTGGKLDLGNGDLIVRGGSLSAVTAAVASGYNLAGGGNWLGNSGITSTSAATSTSHLIALGVVQNNQGGSPLFAALSTFDGTGPAGDDVLVKYTCFGDANLDGKVDGSDYSRIDAGYASAGALTGWFNGDFNYDGVVDGSDYTLIDNAFNNQGSVVSSTALVADSTAQIAGQVAAVPEPAAMVLGAGLTILSARRRKSRRV